MCFRWNLRNLTEPLYFDYTYVKFEFLLCYHVAVDVVDSSQTQFVSILWDFGNKSRPAVCSCRIEQLNLRSDFSAGAAQQQRKMRKFNVLSYQPQAFCFCLAGDHAAYFSECCFLHFYIHLDNVVTHTYLREDWAKPYFILNSCVFLRIYHDKQSPVKQHIGLV